LGTSSRSEKSHSFELARKIAGLCLTKKAEDVIIMDLRTLTSMTDYFVICSGGTDKQVKAIADAVLDGLVEEGIKPWQKEGLENATWALIDFVDVVTHIFLNDKRNLYNLEDLWGDAEITHIADNSNGENGES